jgi:anti-anti-sigma regulatory factor
MAAGSPGTIVCDATSLAPDLVAVDVLARLQLDARRSGRELVLRGASRELLRLLELCGVAGVLGVEPCGQTEEREQRGGVQEEREADDPAL